MNQNQHTHPEQKGPGNDSPFSNEPITPETLPDYSVVELNPVATAYRPYVMLTGAFSALVFTAVVSFGAFLFGDFRWALGLGLVASASLPAVLIHGWLDPRYRGWAVRDHDLIHAYGVIWRQTVVLPLARIQHVETATGPIERLFGLMRLQCFSAGGASADLVIHGLRPETALRIRTHLLERIRSAEPPEYHGGVDQEGETAGHE